MKFRKHMAGESSGWLLKIIGIAVFIMIGVPLLKQCAQEAPRVVAGVASQAVDAAGDAISDMASSAVDAAENQIKAAVCDWPVVGDPCPGSAASTAPSQATACMAQDDAARIGLAQARACTQTYGREFSGNVSLNTASGGNCFSSDGPYPGDERSGYTPPESRPGWTRVANYHSHPMAESSARFSIGDLCNYVANDEVGYVVATDFYLIKDWETPLFHVKDWRFPFLGDDGVVRRFDPVKGAKFDNPDIPGCVAHPGTCSWLELKLDYDTGDVGTITRLPALSRAVQACPTAQVKAAMARAAAAPASQSDKKTTCMRAS